MSKPKQLLPCPFCLSDDVAITPVYSWSYFIYAEVTCWNCHATGPTAKTKGWAKRKWNINAGTLRRKAEYYANNRHTQG